MASPAKTLSALLSHTTIDDHNEILQACNVSLKQSKTDLETQHIRFVALLKLDRFDDALRVLDEAGDKLKQEAKLERAYALYKTGELQEAKEIARGIEADRGARHVEAQASYRSEDFANAADVYRELSNTDDAHRDGESDLRVNSGATDAQLEWNRQGGLVLRKSHGREDLEAFETAYNAACGCIARGEFAKGEFLLNTAKGLCASLDGLPDSEKTAEILPIQVQQLYVLGKLGKTAEAEKLASEIAVQDIPDASTRQIAQNNLLASTSTRSNPYLSHRLLNSSPPLPKTDNLFAHQTSLTTQNALTLSLLSSKPLAVTKFTTRTLSTTTPTLSPNTNTLSVLNAASHAQSALGHLGLKSILPLLSQRPTDIGLAMTIIQLYILTSNPTAASTVLSSLLSQIARAGAGGKHAEDILHAPGLVALQVSLYTRQKRRSAIREVLAKAASHWRRKPKAEQRPVNLLQAAGLALLESPKPEDQAEARGIFEALHTADRGSSFAKAGYVAAHAVASPASVVEEAATLPPVARLVAGIDVAALEEAGVPSLPSALAAASASGAKKRKAEPTEKPKKKRVRKSRVPKDLETPGKKADPERWMPLRDRSSYRPKGRKGKRKQEEKTQGGPVSVEKATEAAKGSGGVVVDKSAGGGGGGKKKGGGKKGRK